MLASSPAEVAIRTSLADSLKAFNAGDFAGYLHDYLPTLDYNGLKVDRSRLVEINQELRGSFPDLRMTYGDGVRVIPLSAQDLVVNVPSEFTGSTQNYDNSGLPATYRESGMAATHYRNAGGRWQVDTLHVSWNDSFIDIGQVFGSIGFTTLPTLVGNNQPYRLRLVVGEDERPGFGVAYAYALAPLKSVIEKAGAEDFFKQLKFKPVASGGIVEQFTAPKARGTYAHVLVVNKFWRQGPQEAIVGQQIYTRLVSVE